MGGSPLREPLGSEERRVKSERKPWFLGVARWYARRRVASAFDGLFVHGLAEARQRVAAGPLIFAMNHVSWWDSFIVVLLDEALRAESHCLMDAQNLARLPFFGWIGAVPLRRANPREALVDLKASVDLLDRPGRVLWIFPQGHQRPSHLRPLGLERGVSILANDAKVDVVPVSLTYTFREAPQPSIAVNIGRPCSLRRAGPPEALEQSLVAGLERNDELLTAGTGEYEALVPPRAAGGVPLAGRFLARFGRGAHA